MKSPKEPPKPLIKIFADHRESRSPVFKILDDIKVDLQIRELEVGDFILSDDVAVERKTAEDALSSFIGEEKGKLFRQCGDLVLSYKKPLLLLECDMSDLFAIRNIHHNSIWGMLRSIICGGCAIEFTYNAAGTAKRLYELALLEQTGEGKQEFQPHGNKSKRNPDEQLVFTVCSIPNIGIVAARALLEKFETIHRLSLADVDDLIQVNGIGKKSAEKIVEFFTRKYKPKEIL